MSRLMDEVGSRVRQMVCNVPPIIVSSRANNGSNAPRSLDAAITAMLHQRVPSINVWQDDEAVDVTQVKSHVAPNKRDPPAGPREDAGAAAMLETLHNEVFDLRKTNQDLRDENDALRVSFEEQSKEHQKLLDEVAALRLQLSSRITDGAGPINCEDLRPPTMKPSVNVVSPAKAVPIANEPVPPTVTTLVIGSMGAGKSTIINSLKISNNVWEEKMIPDLFMLNRTRVMQSLLADVQKRPGHYRLLFVVPLTSDNSLYDSDLNMIQTIVGAIRNLHPTVSFGVIVNKVGRSLVTQGTNRGDLARKIGVSAQGIRIVQMIDEVKSTHLLPCEIAGQVSELVKSVPSFDI
ncbi:hypothetical protein AMAG_12885 [Allomyces macrogynus ATCC 38327]|uniref:Uncharacterized protein n=1 Tax=Allomyces macrogynus (strain ATCC 38327) TaxID=578462 RepID=A0A0L0T0A8_ALLM3|nr:hypothetical protein AMAG_12885 [Allomyces macrogynus ATCC 38327]|eukprot:KNE68206.1 hypothetical protein AMAG_12885 [Allomyces macrogynus ATCC 38327]